MASTASQAETPLPRSLLLPWYFRPNLPQSQDSCKIACRGIWAIPKSSVSKHEDVQLESTFLLGTRIEETYSAPEDSDDEF